MPEARPDFPSLPRMSQNEDIDRYLVRNDYFARIMLHREIVSRNKEMLGCEWSGQDPSSIRRQSRYIPLSQTMVEDFDLLLDNNINPHVGEQMYGHSNRNKEVV
jgi:hypothetical protein